MGFFSKDNKAQPVQETPKQDNLAPTVLKPEPKPIIKGNDKVNTRKQSPSGDAAGESIIAEGTVLIGEVKSNKAVIVHGTVQGKINIQSDLIVAESGLVEADVSAENVSISGRIKGRTEARQLFELKTTGTIEGEIVAKSVKIDEGGRVIGKIDMQQGGSPQASAQMNDEDLKKKKDFLRGNAKENT
ncbi:MAG: polymer-forming cytoskeletal protein [Candidatus Coatesbacteria bacterium]|nr:polymer-forming cytoskeletal protein [Candidatus Coatesbacteria bacterium]